MNPTFDLSRWGLLVKQHWIENKKRYLLSMVAMAGVLFMWFFFASLIDVFDIEVNEKDPEKFVQIVKALEPTFGGVNLEDIKAPECFYIEKALREQMSIPVMHDDQHGTAIISSAALLNALQIQKKKIDRVRFVVNGAGAANALVLNQRSGEGLSTRQSPTRFGRM